MKTILILTLTVAFSWGVFAQKNATKPIATNFKEVINQIEYPLEARSQAIEGDVTVVVKVNNLGKVTSFEVKNACDPVLEKAIEKVIPNLQFIPAINPDGNSVDSEIEIPFKFRLDIS